ncbi:MAG: metal ABC transporter substrate-binding protein, partial [Actinobacteria bacterium]|nr:metal ABC transporter substrate-binding protein [Actinomycetota bacterium]
MTFFKSKVFTDRLPSRGLVPLIMVAFLLCALLVVNGCGNRQAAGKMKVVASIVPLADFCKNVGGDLVEVKTIVPPGATEHTFEPTYGQMKSLSESRVFVMNGLELERWATDVVRKVGKAGLVTVVVADAVPRTRLLETEGVNDPHVWLDPSLAVYEVNAIRDAFIKTDPSHEDAYTKNAASYVKKLETLDSEIKKVTSKFSKKDFVAFHPAWTYFAARYGLRQAGVVEEFPGKEPSAQDIAGLVDKIKALGIKVVFAEPQF